MNKIIAILLLFAISNALNAQELFQAKSFSYDSLELPYRILYPENFNSNEKYPLVLFLHGSGEKGDDNKKQLVHGSKLFEQSREEFPAIVIFPQCPVESRWTKLMNEGAETEINYDESPALGMTMVLGLLDSLLKLDFIDQTRIYGGGLSMGGRGTFEIVWRRPEIFAAAFAICGDACLDCAKDYNPDLSMWIFHGAKDDVVLPENSKLMAEKLKPVISEVKYTLYPEANHNSWDPAFAEPELLPWLYSKRLK